MRNYIIAGIIVAMIYNIAFCYFESMQDYSGYQIQCANNLYDDVGMAKLRDTQVSRCDFERTEETQNNIAQEPVRVEGRFIGEFELTAYCLTGTMANGQKVFDGAVAVDPDVIPLGTHIRIEDLGDFVACDTGAVIKGNIIDISMAGEYQKCVDFGRKTRKVWIIK